MKSRALSIFVLLIVLATSCALPAAQAQTPAPPPQVTTTASVGTPTPTPLVKQDLQDTYIRSGDCLIGTSAVQIRDEANQNKVLGNLKANEIVEVIRRTGDQQYLIVKRADGSEAAVWAPKEANSDKSQLWRLAQAADKDNGPEYKITKIYIDTDFNDGTYRGFSENIRNNPGKGQSETSKREIIVDPTNSGKGNVVAFTLSGAGAGFDGKHRLQIQPDKTTPGFADFNPGSYGGSMDFFIDPGTVSFASASGNRNFTLLEAFDVGEEAFEGYTWQPSFKVHIERQNGQDVMALYFGNRGGGLRRAGVSQVPIPMRAWNNVRYANIDGKLYFWLNGQLDSDISNISMPSFFRHGAATGTSFGAYAGIDFIYPGQGFRELIDNVKLYNIEPN